MRENLMVLRALGVPATPGYLRTLAWPPEPLPVALLGRLSNSEFAEKGIGQLADDSPTR